MGNKHAKSPRQQVGGNRGGFLHRHRDTDSNRGSGSGVQVDGHTMPPAAPIGGVKQPPLGQQQPQQRAHGQQQQQHRTHGQQQQQQYGAPSSSSATSSASFASSGTSSSSVLLSKLGQMDLSVIFTEEEVQAIRDHICALLDQTPDEPVHIPHEDFFRFLGASPTSVYFKRLYALFDTQGKGYVNFDDLVQGLAMLSQKATREQKMVLSFHLLDLDNTGYISRKTTTEVLKSCLAECRELEIHLTDKQIAQVVDCTFEEADADRNNLIDLKEYQALDEKHPGLFDFLTVDAVGALSHLEKVHSIGGTMSGAV